MDLYLSLIALVINGKRFYRINYDRETGGNWFEEIIDKSTHVIKGLTQDQIDQLCEKDNLTVLPNVYTAEELLYFPGSSIEELISTQRRSERIENKKQRKR